MYCKISKNERNIELLSLSLSQSFEKYTDMKKKEKDNHQLIKSKRAIDAQ